jgi:hypothetical protein
MIERFVWVWYIVTTAWSVRLLTEGQSPRTDCEDDEKTAIKERPPSSAVNFKLIKPKRNKRRNISRNMLRAVTRGI